MAPYLPPPSSSATRARRRSPQLSLCDTGVKGAALAKLPHPRKLLKLNLADSRMTDAEVPALAKLTRLASLNLGHTALTDAAVDTLLKLTSLKQLIINQTRISDQGTQRLRKARRLRNSLRLRTHPSLVGRFGCHAHACRGPVHPRRRRMATQAWTWHPLQLMLSNQNSLGIVFAVKIRTGPIRPESNSQSPFFQSRQVVKV